ncbi:hypothetical protein SAMN04488115_11455 [Bosea lathyri]|uniref:Uncharacterized protein n=1 Tax=Bosea lathyri TaxID=1036778 RepID=A0A1H6D207_9HYPH|nr:hypothetical protein SAMN04488115_11455 [Bosea lathyri]
MAWPARPPSSAAQDHRLGGDQQAGHRSRILDRRAHDLGRVDDASLDEIAIGSGLLYSPASSSLPITTRRHRRHCRRSGGPERRSPCGRSRCRSSDHRWRVPGLQCLDRTQKGDAASRQNALFHRSAGGVQGIVDAVLLLLDLDLGRAPTRMTATPPASLARRSWSFSRANSDYSEEEIGWALEPLEALPAGTKFVPRPSRTN